MPASLHPTQTPIRAVFFDLDDTLCDARTAFAEASAVAFRALLARHPHLTETQVVAEWRALHVPMLADLSAGRRTMAEVRLLRFRILLGALGVPDNPFADGLDLLLGRTQLGLLRPFEGVPDVLDELRGRGLHVGVVTNGAGDGHPDSQRSKAEHLGLLAHVDSLFVSDEIGHRKPDPRAFLPALVAAGCADSPHEALFIGDSVENDVAGANAAGMVSVLLRHPSNGRAVSAEPSVAGFVAGAQPHHVISSMAEVLGLLAPAGGGREAARGPA